MAKRLWLVWVIGFMLISANAFAGHHQGKWVPRQGILLVAFGSSMPEAQVSFKNIDQQVKKAFPDMPVRWAYTSHIIRKKMAQEQGRQMDSVAMALARMMDEGFTHVAVQSLHTIRGEEFDKMAATVRAFGHMPGGIRRIVIGDPLLSSQADLENVSRAMIANIPASRKRQDAVVLMGHGTHHPANAFYAALMFNLQQKDPNVYIGTVEGAPELGDIQSLLVKNKVRKVYLMPFMSVAGDHARNDMAGPDEDSWNSVLTGAGFQCQVVLKGTAEYVNIVTIWIEHLQAALERLGKRRGYAHS